MKTITFSIAAYNVQDYLRQCLDTFIVSDCLNDIEVIIVNDGSKDGTAVIAQEYCEKYPNTFKLINKENGGHGSTINKALEIATGKYFRPIDGDDWVKSENLSSFIKILNSTNSDAVISNFDEIYVADNITKVISYPFLPNEKEFCFSDILWKETVPFHAIFYKTTILKDNDFKLSEGIFYEDTEYSLFPLQYIESLFYIPMSFYCYRLGRQGQSISLESVIKHITDLETVLSNVFNFYTKHSANIEKEAYYKLRIHNVLNFFFKFTLMPEWYTNKDYQKIKRNTFNKLEKLNPPLFHSYLADSFLKKTQRLFNYHFDGILIRAKKIIKGNK